MAYIFLDESGHFGKSRNGEEYFIIGSFTVGDPRKTAKGFKSWFRNRFPKKIAKRSEVKWSSSGIGDELRLRTLKRIARLDVRIRYVYFLKKNIPAEYRDGDKFKDSWLYTNVIAELLDLYMPNTDPDFRVFCDQRRLSRITLQEFKDFLKARILPSLAAKVVLQVEMIDSSTSANIQIADWISGALARYHEKGKKGQDFYDALRGNIMEKGKELFTGLIIDIEN